MPPIDTRIAAAPADVPISSIDVAVRKVARTKTDTPVTPEVTTIIDPEGSLSTLPNSGSRRWPECSGFETGLGNTRAVSMITPAATQAAMTNDTLQEWMEAEV